MIADIVPRGARAASPRAGAASRVRAQASSARLCTRVVRPLVSSPGRRASSAASATGDQQPRAAVGQDVLHLAGLEVPVDRAPQRTQPARDQHDLQRFWTIGQQQRDDVAFTEAGRSQRARGLQDPLVERLAVDALAIELDGRFHAGHSDGRSGTTKRPRRDSAEAVGLCIDAGHTASLQRLDRRGAHGLTV